MYLLQECYSVKCTQLAFCKNINGVLKKTHGEFVLLINMHLVTCGQA